MSERQLYRSGFLAIHLFCLLALCMNCPFVPWAVAQTCGGEGVAVQVLGSGGPELQDKRASSSYLVWQDGQARVLVTVAAYASICDRTDRSTGACQAARVVSPDAPDLGQGRTDPIGNQKELFGPCCICKRSRLLSRTVKLSNAD